jgi:hypothetical protein
MWRLSARTTQEDDMNPEIIRMIMNDRVQERQAAAAAERKHRGLRPQRVSRIRRPRTTFTTRTA